MCLICEVKRLMQNHKAVSILAVSEEMERGHYVIRVRVVT